MVHVYALESLLSLLDSDDAFNYEVVRDCYEAFALYCFERYLITCLGGEDNTIKFMESKSLISSSIPLIEESHTYARNSHISKYESMPKVVILVSSCYNFKT